MAENEENLPPKLAADLSRALGSRVDIPRNVDEAILGMGRRHAVRRRRFAYWRSTLAAAAAVMLLLVGWMFWPHDKPQLAMDIDASGQVDILDAYQLAKTLPSGQDLTGDGMIDQADVDAIAKAAVDLNRGTR